MHLEHIAIWVEDIEAVRQFYMTYFKMTSSEKYVNPVKGYTSYFLMFVGETSRIELMHLEQGMSDRENRPYRKGLAHVAVAVGGKEAVHVLTEQLRKDGYEIAGEPRTTGDGYYESVVLDPEGNCIEICA